MAEILSIMKVAYQFEIFSLPGNMLTLMGGIPAVKKLKSFTLRTCRYQYGKLKCSIIPGVTDLMQHAVIW